jgi:hypothetical protein
MRAIILGSGYDFSTFETPTPTGLKLPPCACQIALLSR